MFSIDSIWTAPEDDEANFAWTREYWERLKPYSDQRRIYLNFAGHSEDSENLVRRSYGGNFEKLTAIKQKYDPGNLFRFNQNIPPAA